MSIPFGLFQSSDPNWSPEKGKMLFRAALACSGATALMSSFEVVSGLLDKVNEEIPLPPDTAREAQG